MSTYNQKNNNKETDISALSQVTSPKKGGFFTGVKPLIVGLMIVVLLLSFAFMPHAKATLEKAEEEKNVQHDMTRSQNLALIEQMKTEAQKASVMNEPHPIQKPEKPPILRHSVKLNKETLARMNAPTTFFNESLTLSESGMGENAQGTILNGNNPNAQFINQQNDITSVTAKRLPHPELTVPAGEMIPATLETAIHSELPGMARAITTRDIYSLEGENVLIPRGSTLVGQFNSTITEGQSRILVVWNRVQLANGVIVTLNSPGTDSIGRSGQGADYINRHFFERFGTSALLSILGAYAANNGVNGQDEYNSKAQYRMAIASSFQQASGQTLQNDLNIKPTLQINQGALINVFVAHDLDFHSVGSSKLPPSPQYRRVASSWK
ncbi:TrbI/VirB10 family protein [Legionella bozemanae]|uniref:Protein LvhB10 n=1 Tax=Legionella bozemanae TaxID=447 RepID=A0A0W0RY91_LEGBO|nr:TrbI/VirB10 family protein [Legionella bozemanae]KTC75889.1 hypothetical protein Lboz_0717 [Legionella bozemanae]STO35486.1 Type IV secretion system protein virB10 [Legionella bozemanae]